MGLYIYKLATTERTQKEKMTGASRHVDGFYNYYISAAAITILPLH